MTEFLRVQEGITSAISNVSICTNILAMSQWRSQCIEEKSMYARHGGVLNSRHTNPHCRNVSWWFRMVSVCENCTSSSIQRVKDAKEISQGEIKLFRHDHVWKTRAPPARDAHAPHMKKPGDAKRQAYQEVSVLSLQSCQYEDKWLFNILHRPPKWWGEGGWCKSYNCCSVLERDFSAGRREGRSKRGERQTDRRIQRQRVE